MPTSVSDGFRHPLGDGTLTPGSDGDGYYVAQDFGDWNDDIDSYHLGEDWNGEIPPNGTGNDDAGDPVYAVSNGVVTQAGYLDSLGYYVVIRHDLPQPITVNGITTTVVVSLYAHLQSAPLVDEGDLVDIGQAIGALGATGDAGGAAHLHFEMRLGVGPGFTDSNGYNRDGPPAGWVDPTDFINAHRVLAPGAISTFADNFNRPDGPIGDGWQNSADNTIAGDMSILDGRLTGVGSGGVAGVYREIDLGNGVNFSATITPVNGFGGLPDRFGTTFLFGGDGSQDSGYGIAVSRSDARYANSAVTLLLDGVEIAYIFSPFQFSGSVDVSFTLRPGGVIAGVIAGASGVFTFQFDPSEINAEIPANAGFEADAVTIVQSLPDSRASVLTYGTIDNVVIETSAALSGDFLVGTSGNDTVVGGEGAEFVFGLGGDDTLVGGDGADHLHGGAGFDTASYDDEFAGVTVHLAGGWAQDGGGDYDTLFDLENIVGSRFGDTLVGNVNNNTIVGGGGHDWIVGLEGDDVLEGGSGINVLLGGSGTDLASYASSTANLWINLAAGVYSAFGVWDVFWESIEGIRGGSGNDSIFGNDFDNRLEGGNGADALIGGDGNDILVGGDGSDWLVGGVGNDHLIGGNGVDVLTGGDGWNLFDLGVAAGWDVAFDFNVAQDRFYLGGQQWSGFLLFDADGDGQVDDTLLGYAGGNFVAINVSGLTLSQWNALVDTHSPATSGGKEMTDPDPEVLPGFGDTAFSRHRVFDFELQLDIANRGFRPNDPFILPADDWGPAAA